MRIDNALVCDAEELLNIYAPYVRDTAISFEYDVPSVSEFAKRIDKISSKYPYIKMTDDYGKIVGYAYAGPFKERKAYDWSVETTIYIRQDSHGKGFGRLLYEELESRLARMGILNVNACIAYANTEDEYLSNASKSFHEKLGYSLVGTFHKCGYKFGKWYDMIWMEKFIGEHGDNPSEVNFNS